MAVQRTNPFRLPWSAWIAPKTNAPELLARVARRGGLRRARIFLSSTTDPYVPLERELRLTRGCLEVLSAHPPEALVLQTRSPFVVRDAGLLARIPTALASVTVTTDDERVRRLLEPDSPSVGRRVATLRALREAGVRTQAAVAPLLPGDPRRLAERLAPVADRVVIDDFFRGDGAGGRRSRAALALLRGAGHAAFAEPGYAAAAVEAFRAVLGPERVLESEAGFNDFAWLD
jgi:DNA repair photolyase